MTDKEKIERHDTLQTLRQRIGGCFGSEDGIFAGHPSDEERAKELRKIAFDAGITLREAREITLGYLHGKEYVADHIKEQMLKVNKFFATKLQ